MAALSSLDTFCSPACLCSPAPPSPSPAPAQTHVVLGTGQPSYFETAHSSQRQLGSGFKAFRLTWGLTPRGSFRDPSEALPRHPMISNIAKWKGKDTLLAKGSLSTGISTNRMSVLPGKKGQPRTVTSWPGWRGVL